MPSPKTAEKAVENKVELITVIAKRTFAIDYSAAELKKMQGDDKEKRSFKGMTRNVLPGESAEVSKADAEKLQEAGAVKIKL